MADIERSIADIERNYEDVKRSFAYNRRSIADDERNDEVRGTRIAAWERNVGASRLLKTFLAV